MCCVFNPSRQSLISKFGFCREKYSKRLLLDKKTIMRRSEKELAHTMVRLQLILYSKKNGNWRFFVPNIWWTPRTYYTDLLPQWRHNYRDTYSEYIFKYYARSFTITVLFFFRRWIYLAKELVLFQPEISRKGAYFSYFIKDMVSRKIEPFLRKKDVLLLHNEHCLAAFYCIAIP
jgi:hypothetical protein